MDKLNDVYITLGDTAKLLNITRQTLHRWRNNNIICGEKIGRIYIFKKKDVNILMVNIINKQIEYFNQEQLTILEKLINDKISTTQ